MKLKLKLIEKLGDRLKERFSKKSLDFMRVLGHLFNIGLCGLLLLNIPFGIIEPIPDVFPIIGNIDDIAEVLLILWSWPRLLVAIREWRTPTPLEEENRLDDNEYIDVQAEVVDHDLSQNEQEVKL